MNLIYVDSPNGTKIDELVRAAPFINADHLHVLRSKQCFPFIYKSFKAPDFDRDAWLTNPQYRENIEGKATSDAQNWSEASSEVEASIELYGCASLQEAADRKFEADLKEQADAKHGLDAKGEPHSDVEPNTRNRSDSASILPSNEFPPEYLKSKRITIDYLKPINSLFSKQEGLGLGMIDQAFDDDVRKMMLYSAFTYKTLQSFHISLTAAASREKLLPHHTRLMASLTQELSRLEGELRHYFTGDHEKYLSLFLGNKKWNELRDQLILEAKQNYSANGFDRFGKPDLFSEDPFVCELMYLQIAEIIDQYALLATHFIVNGYERYYTESRHGSIDLICCKSIAMIYRCFYPEENPRRIFFEDLSKANCLPQAIMVELNAVAESLRSALQLDKYSMFRFNAPEAKMIDFDKCETSFVAVAKILDKKDKEINRVVNFFRTQARTDAIRIDDAQLLENSQILLSILEYLMKLTTIGQVQRSVFVIYHQCSEAIFNYLSHLSTRVTNHAITAGTMTFGS